MKEVYGIDLGTTNSCIAVIGKDGLPQVIKNNDEGFTTPSVVFYGEDDGTYVGEDAKREMKSDIERTVAFIKREMSNKTYKRCIEDKELSPVEISALILKKVVDDANEQRDIEGLPPIHKAVITVPAYFGNMERALTRQAGEIAGLEVLDLLNEPTAAALSYGTKGLEGKTFMIYDLGGGTFDVSIMRMKNGILETLATDGDHHLGGVDWDIALLDYVLQQNGLDVTYEDIKDQRNVGDMLLKAESCKKLLSKQDKASFKLIYKRRPYTLEVSRSVFEELTEGLLDNTIDLVHHAMKLCTVPDVKIDEIILIGGSSYMPMVKKRLQEEFTCPIRLDNLEPDRAVAKGAAMHAASLEGDKVAVKLGSDKGSRSYGVRCWDEKEKVFYVSNLVRRTDDLLFNYVSGEEDFYTNRDDQESVLFGLYENISEKYSIDIDLCTLIEEKELRWGFPVPKGTPVIIHVSRATDCTVRVWAECKGARVEFKVEPEGLFDEKEVETMRRDLADKRV